MQIKLCIEILCVLAVQAFVEMAKVLLSLPGVIYILSEKLPGPFRVVTQTDLIVGKNRPHCRHGPT